MTEAWKAIPSAPGYEASDLGGVRKTSTGRVLRQRLTDHGYVTVTLCLGHGDGETEYVHALVLEAFVGPRPVGMQSCHGNGVRTDNRASNLRWDTVSGNAADRIIHKTVPAGDKHWSRRMPELRARGERHGNAKLSDAQVVELLQRTGTSTEVAKEFNVSSSHVRSLRLGRLRANGGSR